MTSALEDGLSALDKANFDSGWIKWPALILGAFGLMNITNNLEDAAQGDKKDQSMASRLVWSIFDIAKIPLAVMAVSGLFNSFTSHNGKSFGENFVDGSGVTWIQNHLANSFNGNADPNATSNNTAVPKKTSDYVYRPPAPGN